MAALVLAAGCARSAEPPVRLPGPAASVLVAPDNFGTLWVVTGGGDFRSTDGGASWHHVAGSISGGTLGLVHKHVLVVGPWGAQMGDFASGRMLPAGAHPPAPLVAVSSPYYPTNRLYALDTSGRLWLSVTAGRSWSRLRASGLPASGTAIAARRDDPALPDQVFVAAGGDGLWRSTDFGASFRRVAGIVAATAVATTTHDSRRVLVADPAGLWLSTDDARSFTRVLRLGGITAIALDTRNWQNAFAATAAGLLLRSDDGGATWADG